MVLHICIPDKFTLPLFRYIVTDLNLSNHHFLFIDSTINLDSSFCDRFTHFKTTNSKFLLRNIWNFGKLAIKAKKIIVHGALLDTFFLLIPINWNKVYWVIQGGIDMPKNSSDVSFRKKINYLYLKKIKNHIGHIEGDSLFVSKFFNKKYNFHYSPVYLSNTVSLDNFPDNAVRLNVRCNVLVGNSTDPHNNHLEILEVLLTQLNQIDLIYVPLSYGDFPVYKQIVKDRAMCLFGEKVIFIEEFMTPSEYVKFLSENIDVAVFNHKRQEAMGVTISLLSLGKTVYLNNTTTSYATFKSRGFQVFDNVLLINESIRKERDVSKNVALLEKYYSKRILNETLREL
jgi:dTDP-N-acetylfucosamine:lipid II N-acetylfucosaminyltransferase